MYFFLSIEGLCQWQALHIIAEMLIQNVQLKDEEK